MQLAEHFSGRLRSQLALRTSYIEQSYRERRSLWLKPERAGDAGGEHAYRDAAAQLQQGY